MSATKEKKELKGLAADKLKKELDHAQGEYFTARMKHKQGELKETHQLRKLRRYIARIKTYLTTAK